MKLRFTLLTVVVAGFLLISNSTNAQYLKVSDNQRFLITDDGKPFFWMGDTGWELFHKLTLDEADHYLRNRSGKGYTIIQSVILAECDGVTIPTPEGFLPLDNNDINSPNPEYFNKVDQIIDLAAKYGLYMAVLPTWGAHAEDKRHPLFDNLNLFTPENAFSYGRFLGNRYKDKWNVVWIAGGDRPPTGNEAIWTKMIEGLREGSQNKHLISYHVNGRHSITEYPEIAKQLDFYMMQSGHGNRAIPNFKMIEDDYHFDPTKPVIDGEPVYEDIPIGFNTINGYTGDYEPRRAMYWSVFAGGFGTTYGNNSVWQMNKEGYPPVLSPLQKWDEAIDSPGSYHVKHLKNLMLSRPFLTRIPDNSLITGDNFSLADFKVATRDGNPGEKDATYIMAYFPIVRELELKTEVIKSNQLRVWYYDPRTGNAYLIGDFENTGSFSVPWKDRLREAMGGPDWVLVIDDANADYPPPGKICD